MIWDLEKTIQLLALIMSYVENTKNEEKKPTIVVCPSSLSLNLERRGYKIYTWFKSSYNKWRFKI